MGRQFQDRRRQKYKTEIHIKKKPENDNQDFKLSEIQLEKSIELNFDLEKYIQIKKENQNKSYNPSISIDLESKNNEQRKKGQKKESLKENRKMEYFLLLCIFVFHNIDLITDYILTYKQFEYYQVKGKTNSEALIFAISLLFALFYARYQQFKLSQEIYLDTQKSKKRTGKLNKKQISTQENIILALYVISGTEQILYFKLKKTNLQNTQKTIKKYLFNKRIIDLYGENFYFFGTGLIFIIRDLYAGEHPSLITLISTIISFICCIMTSYQIYIYKIKKAYKYKEKNFEDFYLFFPLDLQLYLSNPAKLYMCKFLAKNKRQQYKKFFRLPKHQQQQFQQQQLNGCNQIKTQTIGLLKRCYIVVYVLIVSLSHILLLILQHVSKHRIKTPQLFVLGFILVLPQYVLYLRLVKFNFQQKQQIKSTCQQLLHSILKIPLIAVIGCITFFQPMTRQQIPFMKQTKEIWQFNFTSSTYIMSVQQIIQIYMMVVAAEVILLERNYDINHIETNEEIDNVTNPDKTIRKIFYTVAALFVLNLLFNIFYAIHQHMQKQQNNNSNKNQPKQSIENGVVVEIEKKQQEKKNKKKKQSAVNIDQVIQEALKNIKQEKERHQSDNLQDLNSQCPNTGKLDNNREIFENQYFYKQNDIFQTTRYGTEQNLAPITTCRSQKEEDDDILDERKRKLNLKNYSMETKENRNTMCQLSV